MILVCFLQELRACIRGPGHCVSNSGIDTSRSQPLSRSVAALEHKIRGCSTWQSNGSPCKIETFILLIAFPRENLLGTDGFNTL